MTDRDAPMDEVLGAILRGAAILLGCNSCNLIVFDAEKAQASVRLGIVSDQEPVIDKLERLIGAPLKGTVFPIANQAGAMAVEAWQTRQVFETTSLADLAGDVFPAFIVRAAEALIGPHRYILVPVLHGERAYGVLVYEKTGTSAFSAQQRELMLRYAERVGELLDNDARMLGTALLAQAERIEGVRLLLDARGEVVGGDVDGGSAEAARVDNLPRGLVDELTSRAIRLLAARSCETGATAPGSVGSDGRDVQRCVWPPAGKSGFDGRRWRCELAPVTLRGEPLVLATLSEHVAASGQSARRQLVHLALGDAAATVTVDPQFRITSCNRAASRLLGYERSDLLEREIGVLFRDPGEIRSILDRQFLFLSDGYHEEDVVIRHKGGQLLRGTVKALMLADGDHELVGYVVMIRDLSAAGAPSVGGDSLSRAMRLERLATMGELAAQLAHEIRNPLLAIGATVESLHASAERDPSGAREEDAHVLALLSSEVTRLDLILRDYMSLAVRSNASLAKTELGELLRGVVRLLSGRRGAARFECELESGFVVRANPEGLKQVFFNLLSNAQEAAGRDGSVRCFAVKDHEYVSVHVEDDGPGLAREPGQCFEPFYTTKTNGTGLGLTVSQRIVAAHGGTISLRNRPEGGCRATVTLPRKASQEGLT